uniref:Uncharacterized protein n=1 Tax=Rousettus aegyptiacus TaxID=9407 RepID=A0A7J8KBL9_ROUAE|nr:hypothetical protein HJG63_008016 [Rousettus aegyptiacus]
MKEASLKTESGSPAGGALEQVPPTKPTQPAGGRKIRVISTGEDICHIGILSPAFKKRKEDCSRSEQQQLITALQPKRNCHDFRLFCSFAMILGKFFKTTFPDFLLKSNKSEPFLRLFGLACGSP